MNIYIFLGPTLSLEEARAELSATYLPPVAQGDIYRATLDQPQAIGIIDGYFERVPAVWHKEILWAMSRGIHVYGSASMGALRAAELEAFGMEGVGAIFEAFRSGALEDDDEVAVAHGPAEDGYRQVSDAMVNIRSTLAKAEFEDVISAATCAELLALAKGIHYAERSYSLLLSRGAERGILGAELSALRAFIPENRVDQKRADALALLRSMRERLSADPTRKRVGYSFAYTDAWDQAQRQASRQQLARGPSGDQVLTQSMLEELRLSGAMERARTGAIMRALALEQARRRGVTVDAEAVQAAADAFRRERGLLEAKATEEWFDEQRIPREEFGQLIREEALIRWVKAAFEPDMERNLQNHLRATGEYGPVISRVRRKKSALEEYGMDSPSLEDARVTEAELFRWYFVEWLGRPMPPDLEDYARAAGFSDGGALRQAVLRELCYRRLSAGGPTMNRPIS